MYVLYYKAFILWFVLFTNIIYSYFVYIPSAWSLPIVSFCWGNQPELREAAGELAERTAVAFFYIIFGGCDIEWLWYCRMTVEWL